MMHYCGEHNDYNDNISVRFALTNDTPYLALSGEIWGIFRELTEEKWPRYIESALYMEVCISDSSKGD